MKRLIPLLFLPILVVAQEEEPFPPKPWPPEHYEPIMERSPFVLPTFVEEVVQKDVEWTSDFRIVSVLKTGDEMVVLVKQISSGERLSIRRKENALGIRLVELQMSPDPHNVSADVEKGGVRGTIQYDESLLSDTPRSVLPNNPALKAE